MRRPSFVAASVLLAGLLLAGRPAVAEWNPESTGGAGVALGTGAYVTLPYVPLQDVSAELVFADRFAIGGKVLFRLDQPHEVLFVPFVAVGSRRSRPPAAYFAAAWVPGSTAGLLSAGCESTIRGPLRVYGEIGLGVALGESAGVSFPFGHLGIRLRF